jgi:Golgi SNAP receptor complex protein 1
MGTHTHKYTSAHSFVSPLGKKKHKQLSECNDAMGRLLTHGARTSSSALLQRYREILYYYTTEYQKTQAALQRKRESAELLKGARGPKREGAGSGGEWGNPQMDQLLRERNAIHSSIRSVGNILSQAMETKEGLRGQRHSLTGANTGLAGIGANLPSISRVVDAIQRKKTRDNAILGTLVAGCICFVIWYIF